MILRGMAEFPIDSEILTIVPLGKVNAARVVDAKIHQRNIRRDALPSNKKAPVLLSGAFGCCWIFSSAQ
jgi:hypothetical protein